MKRKVFCPQCRTFWDYGFDRKRHDGKIVQPTQANRLTCNKCHETVKFQASEDSLTEDRPLQKADRMDDDE